MQKKWIVKEKRRKETRTIKMSQNGNKSVDRKSVV